MLLQAAAVFFGLSLRGGKADDYEALQAERCSVLGSRAVIAVVMFSALLVLHVAACIPIDAVMRATRPVRIDQVNVLWPVGYLVNTDAAGPRGFKLGPLFEVVATGSGTGAGPAAQFATEPARLVERGVRQLRGDLVIQWSAAYDEGVLWSPPPFSLGL